MNLVKSTFTALQFNTGKLVKSVDTLLEFNTLQIRKSVTTTLLHENINGILSLADSRCIRYGEKITLQNGQCIPVKTYSINHPAQQLASGTLELAGDQTSLFALGESTPVTLSRIYQTPEGFFELVLDELIVLSGAEIKRDSNSISTSVAVISPGSELTKININISFVPTIDGENLQVRFGSEPIRLINNSINTVISELCNIVGFTGTTFIDLPDFRIPQLNFIRKTIWPWLVTTSRLRGGACSVDTRTGDLRILRVLGIEPQPIELQKLFESMSEKTNETIRTNRQEILGSFPPPPATKEIRVLLDREIERQVDRPDDQDGQTTQIVTNFDVECLLGSRLLETSKREEIEYLSFPNFNELTTDVTQFSYNDFGQLSFSRRLFRNTGPEVITIPPVEVDNGVIVYSTIPVANQITCWTTLAGLSDTQRSFTVPDLTTFISNDAILVRQIREPLTSCIGFDVDYTADFAIEPELAAVFQLEVDPVTQPLNSFLKLYRIDNLNDPVPFGDITDTSGDAFYLDGGQLRARTGVIDQGIYVPALVEADGNERFASAINSFTTSDPANSVVISNDPNLGAIATISIGAAVGSSSQVFGRPLFDVPVVVPANQPPPIPDGIGEAGEPRTAWRGFISFTPNFVDPEDVNSLPPTQIQGSLKYYPDRTTNQWEFYIRTDDFNGVDIDPPVSRGRAPLRQIWEEDEPEIRTLEFNRSNIGSTSGITYFQTDLLFNGISVFSYDPDTETLAAAATNFETDPQVLADYFIINRSDTTSAGTLVNVRFLIASNGDASAAPDFTFLQTNNPNDPAEREGFRLLGGVGSSPQPSARDLSSIFYTSTGTNGISWEETSGATSATPTTLDFINSSGLLFPGIAGGVDTIESRILSSPDPAGSNNETGFSEQMNAAFTGISVSGSDISGNITLTYVRGGGVDATFFRKSTPDPTQWTGTFTFTEYDDVAAGDFVEPVNTSGGGLGAT